MLAPIIALHLFLEYINILILCIILFLLGRQIFCLDEKGEGSRKLGYRGKGGGTK
jgi:hypothetical protein